MHESERRNVRTCILSGNTRPLLKSNINHKIYATRHSYDCRFDTGPYPTMQNVYFLKLHAIKRVLPEYDWVFWIDDDAFFTNFDTKLDQFIDGLENTVFLVVCQGIVRNMRGQFAFLNSGVFFLKNCRESLSFLDAANSIPLATVKSRWNSRRLGIFTSGDQDTITYILHEQHLMPSVRLLPYNAFNTRPFHYSKTADEHFIVHFAGSRDKPAAIRAFGRKYSLDETTLVPFSLLEQSSLKS